MVKTSVYQQLKRGIGRRGLFYVTRDAERASAGLLLGLANYQIITNETPFAAQLKKQHPAQIVMIQNSGTAGGKPLSTAELLKNSITTRLIKKNDLVVVFKNTLQIEKICAEKKWRILNPSAELAARVEEKISQIDWLGPLTKYLPVYQVDICKNIRWKEKKFILQFNRSHTGSGTILITEKKQLDEIKKKFPNREARTAEFIEGPLFTNNNIVCGKKILLGNISYQITGLSPFTDLPFATIGNDWAFPIKILRPKQLAEYKKIARAVGRRLAASGWRGLFGIDVVMNAKTGALRLLEINARQPASTTYESELQYNVINRHSGRKNCHSDPPVGGEESAIVAQKGQILRSLLPPQDDNQGIATFAAHLAALLRIEPATPLVCIKDGAQVIQRVTRDIPRLAEPQIYKPDHLKYIYYQNTDYNADLLRIQTNRGIIDRHGQLNSEGKNILKAIKKYKLL